MHRASVELKNLQKEKAQNDTQKRFKKSVMKKIVRLFHLLHKMRVISAYKIQKLVRKFLRISRIQKELLAHKKTQSALTIQV